MKNLQDIYPCSPLQEGMLFHCLSAPGSGVYVNQCSCTLRGGLDPVVFRRTWEEAVSRHAVLRTGFLWDEVERPLQVVRHSVRLPWRELDWRDMREEARRESFEQLLADERRRGFDLAKAPLLRLVLIHAGDDLWYFAWTFHHLLLDGWSTNLLLGEVFAIYGALRTGGTFGEVRPLPFKRYIAWLQQQDATEAEEFWREELRGLEAPTRLGLERAPGGESPSPAEPRTAGRRLPPLASGALLALAQRQRLTANTLVQGAWALLLGRYAGSRDVVYGAVASGRPPELPRVESIVGLFINTLPMRVRWTAHEPVLSWLESFQEHQVELRRFEHSHLAQIRKWSGLPSGSSLFEIVFAFENYPAAVGTRHDGAARSLEVLDLQQAESSSYPLTLAAEVSSGRIALRAAYDPRLYDPTAMHRLLDHLERMLLGIAADPHRPLEALPLLSAAERHQLALEWNDTGTADGEHLLHGLFAAQAARTPDAVAVVSETGEITFGALRARASRLASHLRSLGVGLEARVGVFLERSPEMVVALLGALEAGAAYVPLDPSYPRERLAFMVEDSGIEVVLTQESLHAAVPGRPARIVCLDSEVPAAGGGNGSALSGGPSPRNLAYVIYTSGTTGRPKAVAMSHRAIANHMTWMQREHPCTPADRVLQKTPLSFDASIWEVFLPLMSGAVLVLARPGGHQDCGYLARVIAERQVTVVQFVPSLLQVFLDEAQLDGCGSLQRVFCGGEALPESLRQRFSARLGAELLNFYGPTEAAIDASIHRCGEGRRTSILPLGRPLSNVRIFVLDVLDGGLDPVPIGSAGELFIGGAGLARGYFGRPDLTAERFVPDPLSGEAGGRLYRTGDLVRLLPDGEIEFLGRRDHQVKLHGVRIELGEIEAALDRHPGIRQSLAMVREDRPGYRRLVAYVVPERGHDPTAEELRGFLQTVLPGSMLPSAFITLAELPLAVQGKVDRGALPAPEAPQAALAWESGAPRTPLEERLAVIWAEVLGLPRVGIHDDFFALGGDSILSIQIVARAGQVGLSLTPQDVFRYPTIAEQVQIARQAPAALAEQGPVTGAVPLTPIQRRFFAAPPDQPHHFNQSVLLAARELVEPSSLRCAVAHLLAHHDALRLRFAVVRQEWHQEIAPPGEAPPVVQIDLAALPAQIRRNALPAAADLLQESLDLAQGPLVRVALFRLGADEPDRLLWIVHHLAVDGVSWRVLLDDFQTALRQLGRGEPVSLPPKTTSFRTWAERLARYRDSPELRKELAYWLAEPRAAVAPLPTGGTREPGRWQRLTAVLNEDDTRALLKEVPAAHRAQMHEILLTALARAFESWTGEPRLLVALEGHGREDLFGDVDLSRTVGWLTTLFPVLLDLTTAASPGEALKAVKEQVRALPNRGLGYGVLRYMGDDEVSRRMALLPQPEVLFNYLGQLDNVLSDASSPFRPAGESPGAESSRRPREHTVEVNALVANGCLQVDWAFDEGLLERSDMEQVCEAFLDELDAITDLGREPVTGSITVSDFPSARLNEDELGRLASLLGERG